MKFLFGILGFFIAARAAAQSTTADSVKVIGIQDNSFIVEEAYNQDAGVVQHITNFTVDRDTRAYELDFTQEWPVGSIKHQLSYMLPLVNSGRPDNTSGIGDVNLNYRYQLVGDGDAIVAVAPRFTVSLPTGSWKTGAGNGAAGYELFLPASIVVSDLLVTHLNAGVQYVPSARNQSGDRAGKARYTFGGSEIFRVHPNLNFMLETIWRREDEVVSAGKLKAGDSWTILPGIRGAFNYKSGLQIVPGIGFPFGIGPSRGERGVYLYLSFEHPFNAQGRAGK
jgi:hypothetical protein